MTQTKQIPSNKVNIPVVLLVLIIAVCFSIIAFILFKPMSQFSATNEPPIVNIPTRNDNTTDALQTEANSIQIRDVDTNFSEIDNDLKELK